MNKSNKLHIGLYNPYLNTFEGYLKSVSVYHNKVSATNNIEEAKSYAKQETACRDGQLVVALTHGGINYKIIKGDKNHETCKMYK